jgi:glycosyltransferase involved in cell wall biosynthesis
MSELETINKKFTDLNVCIIIPTYNNGGTLARVIEDVSAYSKNVIVVNDGSTDDTLKIIESFPFVKYITYPVNVGKGWGLRKAFKFALSLGYDYAITIDSDGQHFAKDIPAFIEKLETVPNAIIVGSRNMDQATIPGKSSFGHKFSNFWFKVETGIDCPDTQSGFRLYPLQLLKNFRFITRKYEFEVEVIVRAAWKGIGMDSVPVTVYYAPKETRVSHFRPFQDFSRVSVLNTFLVIIAFAYIKPRDFIRAIFSKKKSPQQIFEQLLSFNQPDHIKAFSVAVGVFSGIIPLWGFQLLAALFIAAVFKLNKAIAIIASNVSIPPMIPIIVFLSYKSGSIWMGSKNPDMAFSFNLSVKAIGHNLQQYIYGSITLAIIAGALTGLLTFILLKLFKRKTVAVF